MKFELVDAEVLSPPSFPRRRESSDGNAHLDPRLRGDDGMGVSRGFNTSRGRSNRSPMKQALRAGTAALASLIICSSAQAMA